MDYTQNLHLPQWEETDRIHHDDFNEAFAALDTAVAANSAAIENGVKIATGSYVGTGACGESNPNSLTFDFVPKLVFVFSDNDSGGQIIWTPGVPRVSSNIRNPYEYSVITSGSGNTFAWYSDATDGLGPSKQLNLSGLTYRWAALG